MGWNTFECWKCGGRTIKVRPGKQHAICAKCGISAEREHRPQSRDQKTLSDSFKED